MKNKFVRIGLLYFALVLLFYIVAKDQIEYNYITTDLNTARGILSEVSDSQIVEQEIVTDLDSLVEIDIPFTTLGKTVTGSMTTTLLDQMSGDILQEKTEIIDGMEDNSTYEWKLNPDVKLENGQRVLLRIQSNCKAGEAPVVYYTDPTTDSLKTYLNGTVMGYSLRYNYVEKNASWFGKHFFGIMIIVGVLIELIMLYSYAAEKRGKYNFIVIMESVMKKYKFLISQLVMRDFKTKYKRSALGYMWSLLNPLLTMSVQYIVFSTIFKGDIKNFPVYLLSGIVLFNFFSEAVGQGLASVVGNAPLITKVYMPKYIFPVTKVISCSINLFISIIPLLVMTLLTGAKITKAILTLPYLLFCLILFSIGLSLILSTAMVFFRDTQYLWGIISLVWMYATPLFYPENILPKQFQLIQKINPLYQMVKFIRIVLIEGTSPEPRRYLYCLIPAVVLCALGGFIFKRNQDKFILYI